VQIMWQVRSVSEVITSTRASLQYTEMTSSINYSRCESCVTVVGPLMALTTPEPLCACGCYRRVLQLLYKLQRHKVNLILRSNLSRTDDTFGECSVCRSSKLPEQWLSYRVKDVITKCSNFSFLDVRNSVCQSSYNF